MATDHRKVSEQLTQEILLEDPNFLREIVEGCSKKCSRRR
jgi:hypothetical protein